MQTVGNCIKQTLTIALVVGALFMIAEPGLSLAQTSDSDSIMVSLTVDSGIAITSPADVTMSPNLGISADSSIGSATWNVKTNDPQGYHLDVKATSSPALQGQSGQGNFTDYTEATPGTPDAWSVDSGNYEFGFSAFGADVEAEHKGTETASCGSSGTPSANLKFEGFTTTDEQIATSATTTSTSGEDTTLCLAAEQNDVFAPAGTYKATIVATATVQ